MVPLEVYPLGIFTGIIISFATFRIYKLINHSEVQLKKGSKDKFQWKEETEQSVTDDANN